MNRILASLVAALAVGALSVNAQDDPKPAQPEAPKAEEKPAPAAAEAPAGKFKPVTVNDLKVKDEARKKDIALFVVAPEGEGKFPVILFSSAQAPQTVGGLANYWASHGYVVIAPTHADTQQGPGGQGPGRNQDRGAMVDRAFDMADADKDGKLSKEEIPAIWADRVQDADTDKDGFLTKAEVRKAFGIEEAPAQPAPEQPKKEEAKPAEKAPEKAPEKKPAPKEEEFGFADDPAQPQPQQPRQGQGRNQGQNRGNRQTIEAAQERVKDFTLLLDSIDKLAESSSALKGKIDKDKIAVAGIGFGAYTAGLLGGVTVDVAEDKKAQSFADKRIKAVIELSPPGSGERGLTKESWKAVKLPMMTLTGSNDRRGMGRRPAEGEEDNSAEWRREAFAGAPEGGKVHVSIEGGSAFMFLGAGLGGQPQRGREGQAETAKQVFIHVQTTTLYFLNANLKGDEASSKLLDAEAMKKATDGKVTVERK